MDVALLVLIVPLVLGLLLLAAGVRGFRRRRGVRGTVGTLSGLLLLVIATCFGLIAAGMRGYRVLTSEQTAATMTVQRGDGHRFSVQMEYPDGSSEDYDLSGDELYVDARILKWHPLANFLGIRTGYQLDRISGRYLEFADEVNQLRTLYQLNQPEDFDLFGIIRRFPQLEPLVDAEYGSASFLPVDDGGIYQLRVSTTGLLIRRID